MQIRFYIFTATSFSSWEYKKLTIALFLTRLTSRENSNFWAFFTLKYQNKRTSVSNTRETKFINAQSNISSFRENRVSYFANNNRWLWRKCPLLFEYFWTTELLWLVGRMRTEHVTVQVTPNNSMYTVNIAKF